MSKGHKQLSEAAYFQLPDNLAFLRVLAARNVKDHVQFTRKFVAFREAILTGDGPPDMPVIRKISSFHGSHTFVTKRLAGNAPSSPLGSLLDAFIDHAGKEPDRWLGPPVGQRSPPVPLPG